MHREQERVDAIEAGLYRRVATVRDRHDRDALTRADELEAAATDYAETLSFRGERGHHVDGSPSDRAEGFAEVRENLAYRKAHGYDPDSTANAVVKSWLTSEEHRKNLLHTDPNLHGLGLRLSGDSLVVCHLFARQRKVNLLATVRSVLGR